MTKSEQIIALESKHGALNYAPIPVVIERASGCRVWDPEGNAYLDFLSGIAAVSQGHCHPRIISALVEQAKKVTLVSRAFYGDTFGAFAKEATEYFGYDRILVMNTGVEAFETAIKLCRKWGYQRKGIPAESAKIIVCENNFHGRTMAAISASSSADSRGGGDFGPFLPNFVFIPFNDLPALQSALRDPAVAGFLVEPIQGEGGVVVPDEGYLKAAAEACRASETLFIADEIQTGIARTGKRLACDHEGVRPDIVLLGKALSGGTMPVSAVLANDPVMLLFKPGDHGSTFGGNPLACAVAREALAVVREEGLAENAEKMGVMFRESVRAMGLSVVKEVRGKGLLNAIELAPGSIKGLDLCLRLKEDGLLCKNSRDHVIRFAPPLVISEAEMKEALSILKRVLSAC